MYSSNQNMIGTYKLMRVEKSTRKKTTKKSGKRRTSEVFEPRKVDLFEVSSTLSDNSHLGSRNDSEPEFLKQFELERIGDYAEPVGLDEANGWNEYERKNSRKQLEESGGWSTFNPRGGANYGFIPESQLTHNNMTPQFRHKYGYGSNDRQRENIFDRKLGLYTGTEDTHIERREVKRMFDPAKDYSYVNGMPSCVDEMRHRQHITDHDAGARPMTSIRQTPGLGLEYDSNATHGHHDPLRIMPKTVDELRVKPKLLHKGRPNHGMKGIAHPVIPKHRVKRRETLFKLGKERMMPTSSIVEAPRSTPNFLPRRCLRGAHLHEYTGAASTTTGSIGSHIPEEMRGKYRESSKILYHRPEPLNKKSTVGDTFNPNTQSYHLPTTLRESIILNNHMGQAIGRGSYADRTDIPDQTLKDVMATTPIAPINVVSNTMRGTALGYELAKTTLKETMISRPNHTQVRAGHGGSLYSSKPLQTTLKETMLPAHRTNVYTGGGNYAEMIKPLKTTIKETTMGLSQPRQATMVGQAQGRTEISQPLDTTIYETTMELPRPSYVSLTGQQATSVHFTEPLRTNLRETVHHLIRPSVITLPGQAQGKTALQQPLKTNIRETTQGITREQQIQLNTQAQGTTHLAQPLRTNLRETTMERQRDGGIAPVGQAQGRTEFTQPLRTTLGEVTMEIPRPLMTNPHSKAGYVELTQPLRTTLRQIIQDAPRSTWIAPVNQTQGAAASFDRTPLATTYKETMLHQSRNNIITPVGQIQGQAGAFDRTPLPTTYKETMIHLPRNRNITPVGQIQGSAAAFDRTPLATTYADTMISLPRSSQITAVGQQRGKVDSFNQTPLPTTLKDLIVDHKHIGIATAPNNSGTGYLADNPQAPTTLKELTIEGGRYGVAGGVSKPMPYDAAYRMEISDKKESALCVNRAPTTCNATRGPDPSIINPSLKTDHQENDWVSAGYLGGVEQRRNLPDYLLRDDCTSSNRSMEPAILEQIMSNPYNISIV
jgi:hypothetical protein